MARLRGIILVPVPSDRYGMIPEELDRIHRKNPLAGVYLMPSCSDPTASSMPEMRKKAIAGVILRRSMILLENDPFAFFSADLDPDYQGPCITACAGTVSIYYQWCRISEYRSERRVHGSRRSGKEAAVQGW